MTARSFANAISVCIMSGAAHPGIGRSAGPHPSCIHAQLQTVRKTMRRRRFAIAGRSTSAWARVKDHSPHRYALRYWPNLPTHERFAKIVLWYRRYDPVAFALRLKAMQYRPRDGGVCRGDMANRSSIQRASSSGVRAVLLSVQSMWLPSNRRQRRGRNRRPAGATVPYFVSPGRNLSIKQGVPTSIQPTSRACLRKSSSCEPVTNIIGNVKPLDAR